MRDKFVTILLIGSELTAVTLRESLSRLQQYLNENFVDYEIVIVNNVTGQLDQEELDATLRIVPSVRVLQLSYPVSYSIGILAGLENSIGDYVVIFNFLQESIETIGRIVDRCGIESEIVMGRANNPRMSIFYRVLRPIIIRLYRGVGYAIESRITTLRCITRRGVNATIKGASMSDQPFLRMLRTGLTAAYLDYDVLDHHLNQRVVGKAIKNSLGILFSSSLTPYKLFNLLGLSLSSMCLLLSVLHLVPAIDRGEDLFFSAFALSISVLLCLLFLNLALLGRYLMRHTAKGAGDSDYWISREQTSRIALSDNRLNVTERT